MSRAAFAFAGVLVASSLVVAWREGGGADVLPAAPRAMPIAPVATSDTLHVTSRLVDALDAARIDVPRLDAARPILDACWRKMRLPWSPHDGLAARVAYMIA